MNLPNPTMEQSGLISVVVGVLGQHGLVYMQEQVKVKNNGKRLQQNLTHQ